MSKKKKHPTAMAPPIPDLPPALAELVDARLTGARCAGRAPLFDSEIPGETPGARAERLEWCAAQCRSCPVLPHCELAANDLEAAQRTGVWACVDRSPALGRPPKQEEGDAA